jgi:hypothetical protein
LKKYIQLEIDGVTVALELGELPFLLSYRISDQLGEAAGSSADRFIDLPASKETNNLYQNYADVATNNKAAIEFKDSTVLINGIPVFSGVSQLQRAILKGRVYNREVSKYKVGLFGQNADWLIKLKGLKLSDLEFTDQLFDSATVQNGWTADYDNGDFFGFCLIKWKLWDNETGGTTAKSSVQVNLSEFTPFLFVRSIIDRISNAIGYNINSNLFNTERFKSLILPIPPVNVYPQTFSEDFLNFGVELPNSTIVAQPPIPTPTEVPILGLNAFKLPNLNAGAWNAATSTFTVFSDGFVIFEGDFLCTNTTGFPPQLCLLGVSINGAPIIILGALGKLTLIGPPGPPVAVGDRSKFESSVFQVSAGDNIQIVSFSIEQAGGPGSCDIQGSIQATFESAFGFNQPIVWEYLLRDWTALDFLNGITDIHNLRFENDEATRTISTDPRNVYADTSQLTGVVTQAGFYDNTTTIDYTSKIDLSKDAELLRLKPKKNQVFKWSTDGPTEQAKEEDQVQGIYEASYILQDNTFLDKDEIKEVRFFSKTIHTTDRIIQSDPTLVSGIDVAPLVPLIYPIDYQTNDQAQEANYNVNPRILHFFGQRGGVDGYIQVSGVGDVELPVSFFVNYNDSSGLDPSLSFSTELINGLEVPGLLDTFYIHQMATLSNAKQLKEWLVWNTLMLNKLSFKDTVFLQSIRYILEEIQDFDPTADNSTKTVLLPYILASLADSDNINSTPLNGLAVLFP